MGGVLRADSRLVGSKRKNFLMENHVTRATYTASGGV
jgi:hypothetical protein